MTPTRLTCPPRTARLDEPHPAQHAWRSRVDRLRQQPWRQALVGEEGEITTWAIMIVTVAVLLAALTVDGAAKMRAGQQAAWQAAEAARVGVNAVGPRPAGPAAHVAALAARAYLADAGVTGTVSVISPTTLQVAATARTVGPFTGATFTATREQRADLLIGVETGQPR